MAVTARFEVPIDELTGEKLDDISRGIPAQASIVITKETKQVETQYSVIDVEYVVFTATYH